MRDNIGDIPWGCHAGADKAFVRKDKKGKFYIYCPECGIFGAKGKKFQDMIEEKATMYGEPVAGYQGGAAEKTEEVKTEQVEVKTEDVEVKPKTADEIYREEMGL